MRCLSVRIGYVGIFVLIYALTVVVQQGCSSAEESDLSDTELPSESASDESTLFPEGVLEQSTPLPEATAEDIWQYITEDEPYTEWSRFPEERIPDFLIWKEGSDYVIAREGAIWTDNTVGRIYVNDIALAALDDEPRDMPNGSIVIHESHRLQANGELGDLWLISGRYKFEGSTKRDNDWVTFGYYTDGKLFDIGFGPVFGTKTHCYSCHELSENDYFWTDSVKLDAKWTNVLPYSAVTPRP